MKILILTKCSLFYLDNFYKKYPSVRSLPFEEQRERMLSDHYFWDADLSIYMKRQGIRTEYIIANAEFLQKKWAEENNFTLYSKADWCNEVAIEQIKRFRPDILWVSSIFEFFGGFLKTVSPYYKKAVTWISCPIPENLDFFGISTLITSQPHIFKGKWHLFKDVIVTKPGFSADILKEIGAVKKKYDIVFVGSLSLFFQSRRAVTLAYLIENGINLDMFISLYEQPFQAKYNKLREAAAHIIRYHDWRKGKNTLREAFLETDYHRNVKRIWRRRKGAVFGLDMYRTLAASRLALNIHGDISSNYAGNARMFEATGVGACLLTENAENITELFTPGEEIITYNTKEELLDIIKAMLRQQDKIEKIAQAGQKRTLKDHTIERVFNDIKPALDI
ncbi:MAG: glycosyltransferase family 1 protein [Candidatus Omnitrophica bacterium]|nr:glycosyltransferase family 1 protein [Candidatus Omnitrophota bacterium]